jgi:hypothetical protein
MNSLILFGFAFAFVWSLLAIYAICKARKNHKQWVEIGRCDPYPIERVLNAIDDRAL